MGIREEIIADLGDMPRRLLERAKSTGQPQTEYLKGVIPVTAYPRDKNEDAVVNRVVDEHRRHSGN